MILFSIVFLETNCFPCNLIKLFLAVAKAISENVVT